MRLKGNKIIKISSCSKEQEAKNNLAHACSKVELSYDNSSVSISNQFLFSCVEVKGEKKKLIQAF